MKRSKGELTLEAHLNAYKIPFEAEYRFCDRRWRFDFAFPAKRVAVEVEGGVWMKKSRHTSPKGYINDMEKYSEAACQGWIVLRFTPQQVKKGDAINKILKTLGEIVTVCPPSSYLTSPPTNPVFPKKKARRVE